MSCELITPAEAKSLAERFESVLDSIQTALESVNSLDAVMNEIAPAYGSPTVRDWLGRALFRSRDFGEIDIPKRLADAQRQLGNRAWCSLLRTTQMRSVLSCSELERLDCEIEETPKAFTEEQILLTYGHYAAALEEIRTRSCVAVLKRLADHPSLRRRRFALQVELPLGQLIGAPQYKHDPLRYSEHMYRTLIQDVELLFYALDRQRLPEPKNRLDEQLLEVINEDQLAYETPYFKALFDPLSRELRLTVKRKDLIERARELWEAREALPAT